MTKAKMEIGIIEVMSKKTSQRFGMDAFWNILSENSDPNGVRFLSTLEAKDYPFYAIQVLLKMLMLFLPHNEKINLDGQLAVPP